MPRVAACEPLAAVYSGRMQKLALWAAVLIVACTSALAQVSVELRLDQEQYLPGETLSVAVRITNRSGQRLVLGREMDWLVFGVESAETGVVPKISDPFVQGEFVLESSKVATKRVDIAPHFPFNKSGRYSVTATVRIPQWGAERASPPASFDIVEGSKIWQQEVGLPNPDGSGGVPEIRRYFLQQANYLRGQIRLYVRVTDESGLKTYRLLPVGKMLSFSRPEPQVDAFSNLHLLYQDGPRTFSYTKYSPDGELLARQTYEMGNTRPRLFVDAEREIGVRGGFRLRLAADIPPPTPAELAAVREAAAQAATNAAPLQAEDTTAKKKKSKR